MPSGQHLGVTWAASTARRQSKPLLKAFAELSNKDAVAGRAVAVDLTEP